MTAPATSLLILTDEESRLIRKALQVYADTACDNMDATREDIVRAGKAEQAFNRGMVRGTEKMKAEFSERMKAKRK